MALRGAVVSYCEGLSDYRIDRLTTRRRRPPPTKVKIGGVALRVALFKPGRPFDSLAPARLAAAHVFLQAIDPPPHGRRGHLLSFAIGIPTNSCGNPARHGRGRCYRLPKSGYTHVEVLKDRRGGVSFARCWVA